MSAPEATLGRVERMVALRSFPGWSEAAAKDLAIVATATRTRQYKAGTVLNEESHPATSVYLIVSGLVRVTMNGVETGVFGAQSAVGGLAAFSGLESGYGIEVLEDTVTLEMDAADMEEIFEDRFPILVQVLRALAGTVIELRKRLPNAGFSAEVTEGPVCPARPLDLIERIFFLGKNLVMAGRIDSVAVMARTAKEIRLRPGDVVWEAGDQGDSMISLVCGRVRCTTPEGLTWEMGANDMIGGLGPLAQQPRWYRVEVVDGMVGLVLPRDVSLDVWEDHPDLAMLMLKIFAKAVLDLQQRVARLREGA